MHGGGAKQVRFNFFFQMRVKFKICFKFRLKIKKSYLFGDLSLYNHPPTYISVSIPNNKVAKFPPLFRYHYFGLVLSIKLYANYHLSSLDIVCRFAVLVVVCLLFRYGQHQVWTLSVS
jgi:hypothetical protein